MAEKCFNEKCDIYSLGIIMWELQTRQLPFSDNKLFFSALEKRIIYDDLRPTVKEEEWNDSDYLLLMKRCWHSNPNLRPSAEKVIACVEDMKSGVSGPVAERIVPIIDLEEKDKNTSTLQIIHSSRSFARTISVKDLSGALQRGGKPRQWNKLGGKEDKRKPSLVEQETSTTHSLKTLNEVKMSGRSKTFLQQFRKNSKNWQLLEHQLPFDSDTSTGVITDPNSNSEENIHSSLQSKPSNDFSESKTEKTGEEKTEEKTEDKTNTDSSFSQADDDSDD